MTFAWAIVPPGTTVKGQLHGEANNLEQLDRPDKSELNYGPPPGRIPRPSSPRLSYMDGFAQHGFQQWYSGLQFCAFLPPLNLARPAMLTNRGTRGLGGLAQAGTQMAGRVHMPSVFVPRSVS